MSLIEGSASFLRPGAEDWTRAWVNTPLAAGDALYTTERTTLEIQVGARAFVRAAEKTHVALVNLEPDFLQIELKAGTATLDLRSLPAAYTVELDTPNAVFTIEHPGYYRADVNGDSTHFIGVGALRNVRGLGAVQHRLVDMGSLLRLDVAR